jgi:hypothetical protein
MGNRVVIFRALARVTAVAAVVVVAGALCGAGCTAPRGPLVVTDPDPSVKIPAIKKATWKHDRGAVQQLVADLDSDDPAVRFYAINGLRRITGKRFGYDYYADEQRRQPSLQRWQNWLAGREAEPAPVVRDASADMGSATRR